MAINWCYTWDMDVDQYNLGTFIDSNKKDNGNNWSIYEKESFSKDTVRLRTDIQEHIGTINYMGVWDYYEGFVDDLGPHVDKADDVAVFLSPRGELTVTMHDKETKEVLDTKVLNNTNAMALYHTEFMHDIHGVGELVVFGVNVDENYFLHT